ncbi:HSP20-like chaperone [Lentinus tigrinus ALCF2SS1-7]|uniref:HSP20-like chaperone n=1 Tax=Lentinus tigrinus ALCF2SS1-6 TaxID=1328759 RepID=A0A5C2SF53_9APHY|nr:HSP20-like chaperone [Lentinus tigrinus ALCF2SS1-6]RPD77820.1 HSP20-like chaperone [Lentinus tigrinus ALCF2SS1-7]
MSLTRQFFRELRPLFRMLEEPFGRPSTYYPSTRAFLDDPFFNSPASGVRPAIDVSEQGNTYIVEAELPGVKKENVDVRIGDGGRTLTIEGKVFSGSAEPQQTQQAQASTEAQQPTSSSTEVTASQTPEQTAISTERTFRGTSKFTRTVLLPQPVDSSKVTAKLSDGVLTVTIPKATDTGSVTVNVE